MIKKPAIILVFLISSISFIFAIIPQSNTNYNKQIILHQDPLDRMPIIKIEGIPAIYGDKPIPRREEDFKKWLSPSFLINADGGSGSGTLAYYDKEKNEAWVISCGHLFNGQKFNTKNSNKNITASIVTWYKNDIKLKKPETYKAKVLFYSNIYGEDMSLMVFNPDWVPLNWFSVAPLDYILEEGDEIHSTGCDRASEVAHYSINLKRFDGKEFITENNSPRPGRSGGGGIYDDYLVGICVKTSNVDGSGYGIFTTFMSINKVFKKEGFDFMLNLDPPGKLIARRIKIISSHQINPDYIPLPSK